MSADRFNRVFVVIDPKRMLQPALIKGEWIAARDGSHLTVYCCVYDGSMDEDKAAQQRELDQIREWLTRLVAPSREYGLEVTLRVEWDNLWREAIVAAAQDADSDLIIKTVSRHSAFGRRLMKTADWSLLAECSCPALLVSDAHLWDNKTLLSALKLKPEDPAHEELNRVIVDVSHKLAKNAGFELHAVTAYRGDDIYFDRQKFADGCRLPRNRVHAGDGSPQQIIAKVAEELGADVVVVGNAGDSVNDTAQRLIDAVNADILVLPSSEGSQVA